MVVIRLDVTIASLDVGSGSGSGIGIGIGNGISGFVHSGLGGLGRALSCRVQVPRSLGSGFVRANRWIVSCAAKEVRVIDLESLLAEPSLVFVGGYDIRVVVIERNLEDATAVHLLTASG